MKARVSLVLAAALLVLAFGTGTAMAGAEFVSFGYAKYTPAVDTVGATVDVYGILTDAGGFPTPIPFDFDNYQHTVHISAWTISSVSNPSAMVRNVTLDGGMIEIFTDNGTAADWANPATFTDGTMVLSANLQDGFGITMLDTNTDGLYSGFGSGMCDMVGGTRLGELTAAEYELANWIVNALNVADPDSGPGVTVPDGWDRVFDLKIVPPNDPTASDPATWSNVKSLFR